MLTKTISSLLECDLPNTSFKMRIRPALPTDIPDIAKIGTVAFADDPSYEHFFPWRSQYPQDFYLYLLHDYRKMLATPGQVIMVAEVDESNELALHDKEAGARIQMVGYATFIRSGSGTAAELAEWNADSLGKSKL